MKRIINNKLYDTDTATLKGSYNNGYYSSDFYHVSIDLYQKRTKEFFLDIEGGPLSKYGETCGRESYGTRQIKPLSNEEAKKWAIKHLNADKYMELFGEVEE